MRLTSTTSLDCEFAGIVHRDDGVTCAILWSLGRRRITIGAEFSTPEVMDQARMIAPGSYIRALLEFKPPEAKSSMRIVSFELLPAGQ